MPADLPQPPSMLACHRCGYDLRAHPPNGHCSECGESVTESHRHAAIPHRPAWKDSDPRWRRRIVAGLWVLTFWPLISIAQAFGLTSMLPAPTLFDYRGNVITLEDTLACMPGVYEPIFFCVGIVLLFSKERGRRSNQLDWAPRWGVLCSYVVLLLRAAEWLFMFALVLSGIAALFQSIPLKYQPGITRLLVELSTGYLRYGAHPTANTTIVCVMFSSVTILLACVPLANALRSTLPNRFRMAWLIPLAFLALFSFTYLIQVGLWFLNPTKGGKTNTDIFHFSVYLQPQLVAQYVRHLATSQYWLRMPSSNVLIEVAKSCIVLGITTWLSLAQLAAWQLHKKATRINRPSLITPHVSDNS